MHRQVNTSFYVAGCLRDQLLVLALLLILLLKRDGLRLRQLLVIVAPSTTMTCGKGIKRASSVYLGKVDGLEGGI